MFDKIFLTWLANRIVTVYNESENVDFVRQLRAIAEATPDNKFTPWLADSDVPDSQARAQAIIAKALDTSQIHPCEWPGCGHTVQFDDEPYCFTHSPDSGSHYNGYSYRDGTRYMLDHDKRSKV